MSGCCLVEGWTWFYFVFFFGERRGRLKIYICMNDSWVGPQQNKRVTRMNPGCKQSNKRVSHHLCVRQSNVKVANEYHFGCCNKKRDRIQHWD